MTELLPPPAETVAPETLSFHVGSSEGPRLSGAAEAVLARPGVERRGRELLRGPRGAICLTCHRLGSLGKAFGPSFDGIGFRRSAEHLLESILNLSRDIEASYVHYTVTTDERSSKAGLIVHHDRERLVLRDAAMTETEIPVGKIVSVTAAETSVMPAGLAAAFPEGELADLLAYLRSLR